MFKKILKATAKVIGAVSFALVGASLLYGQSITEILGSGLVFRTNNPVIKVPGTLTVETLAGTDLKVFDTSGNDVTTGDVTAGDDFLLGSAASSFGGFAASVTPATTTRVLAFPAIASTIATPGNTSAISNAGYIKITIGGTDFRIPVLEDE
jgi:hypothetical protein